MYHRKTLQIFDNFPHETSPPTVHSTNRTATSPPQMESPFDSSTALTVLVLLTGLFFIGFFSVFIRRVYHDSEAGVRQPHNRRLSLRSSLTSSRKGLEPSVIGSLPVWNYYGEAKYYNQEDCAICLGDFEENDVVKVIPRCRHVFHVECIDTWIVAHASCPVCRGTQFFGSGGNVLERTEQRVDEDESEEGRSTVEISETCIDMRTLRVRRSSSCSSMSSSCLGDQDVDSQRTSSFG